jgi:hypothetical protein
LEEIEESYLQLAPETRWTLSSLVGVISVKPTLSEVVNRSILSHMEKENKI